MQTLYIDVLFIINFSMDLLALWFSGGLLHLPRKKGPLLLASSVGGVYAVLAVLYPGNGTVQSAISIAVALLLCFTAYGGKASKGRFLLVSGTFYLLSFLLGGAVTAFYGMLSSMREDGILFPEDGEEGRRLLFFLLVLLSGMLLSFIGRRILSHSDQREAEVRILCHGRECLISALVDTGNSLRDPLSGRGGLVVRADAISSILPEDILRLVKNGGIDPSGLSGESRKRIRLIPAESLGAEQLLIGYLPDSVEIAGKEKGGSRVFYPVDAVLVLCGDGNQTFNGFDGILPSALVA